MKKPTSAIFYTDDCGIVLYLSINPDNSFGLSMYTYRTDHDGPPLDWLERLRFAWHVIRHGYTWTGETIELDRESAWGMGEWIKEAARDELQKALARGDR